jgi:hypothetical protein
MRRLLGVFDHDQRGRIHCHVAGATPGNLRWHDKFITENCMR